MKKTVLIVEDEHNLNVLYDTFIKMWGYDTIQAYSGKDGLDAYRTQKPDAVVTDHQMRGMTGKELVDIIRETDKETPILWHTGANIPTVIGVPNLYVGQKGADIGYIKAFLKVALDNKPAEEARTWIPK